MFNASYWGHGYATEALRAFMPLFFEHYSGCRPADHQAGASRDDASSNGDSGSGHATNGGGSNGCSNKTERLAPRYDYAEAHTDPDLVSSQNVLTKVGFRLHERKERDFENPVLGIRDTLVYRMYRSDVRGASAVKTA